MTTLAWVLALAALVPAGLCTAYGVRFSHTPGAARAKVLTVLAVVSILVLSAAGYGFLGRFSDWDTREVDEFTDWQLAARITEARRAVKADPENEAAQMKLAQSYYAAGLYKDAVDTLDAAVTLCGETVCHRVRVLNHDAWDEANMVYLGKTSRGTEVSVNRLVAEADRVILTGGIIYHYMVGYGGGRKSILPGCSSIKTIRQNHLWALAPGGASGSNPNAFSGRTEGNECHEDMMEIAAFVKPDFILNVVPTPKGDFAGIFAGNWISAWQKGTKLVDEIYGVAIPEKGDIVITTAGGFPKDINLYQTGKTMDNAYYAVKRGGVVILLSECPDIYEPPEFSDWFKYGSRQEMEAALRKNFGIPGWVVLKEMECGDIATFVMVTLPQNAELVKKANMIPVSTIEEALAIAKERCASDAPRYIVMPQGANTVPLLDGKVSVG